MIDELIREHKIREQKDFANVILNKFKENNIECYLMGGAPRNWYFNKEANDLDFYIHQNNDFDRIVKFLKEEFIDLKELGNSEYIDEEPGFEFDNNDNLLFKGLKLNVSEHINDYISKMPSLKKVFECKYYNVQKYQFMIVSRNPMNIINDEFGTTISQFYYWNDKIFCTGKAKFSIETKTIYFKDGYDLENKYIKKMKEYFPDYEFKSDRFYEEDFIDYAKERLIDNLERNY